MACPKPGGSAPCCRKHGNVSVLACRKALERLSYLKGVDVELLDGVLIAPSALDQILMRMRQGWLYIRV